MFLAILIFFIKKLSLLPATFEKQKCCKCSNFNFFKKTFPWVLLAEI